MAKFDKLDCNPSWNNMKTPKITERMLDLYETCKWHDCIFKLTDSQGTEVLVPAHAAILASSSPVFEALCFGPLAEKTVAVPDIDSSAFKMMLKFIYTDSIEFPSVEDACNILYASKKYLIYSLAGMAISYISHHISESNCLQVYTFAKYVQEENLTKVAWNYLCSHLDDCFKYFSNESLSIYLVKNLVNAESLNGSEIIVYKICLMWAKAECERKNLEKTNQNLREVLITADLLNKIRWLTLTLKEFEEGPQKSGILTDEEVEFISKAITLNCKSESITFETGSKTVRQICKLNNPENLQNLLQDGRDFQISINNNMEMRKRIQLNKFYCHRFIVEQNNRNIDYNNLKIQTHIVANKSVRLTAIFLNAKVLPNSYSCYGKANATENCYKENLLLCIHDSNNEQLFSTLFYENVIYGSVFKISLPRAVFLEHSQKYKIQIDLFNSSHNYLFGVRNSISKFPSGLCVEFEDLANTNTDGKFKVDKCMSLISGLELCL